MDAPVCRLCGSKHYASAPHTFKEPASGSQPCSECKSHKATIAELRARIKELETAVADPVSNFQANILANKDSVSAPLAPSVSKPANRAEYMRNLMRDRRAKAKVAHDPKP